jgi:hypothetical protein
MYGWGQGWEVHLHMILSRVNIIACAYTCMVRVSHFSRTLENTRSVSLLRVYHDGLLHSKLYFLLSRWDNSKMMMRSAVCGHINQWQSFTVIIKYHLRYTIAGALLSYDWQHSQLVYISITTNTRVMVMMPHWVAGKAQIYFIYLFI